MSDARQKKQLKLLGVLLAVLLAVLYWSWASSTSVTPTSQSGQPFASMGLEDFVLGGGTPGGRSGRGIPVSEINSRIHFERLGQMERVQPSLARNMFAFHTPPPRSPPGTTSRGNSLKKDPDGLRPQGGAPRRGSSARRGAGAINLKYYGFRKDLLEEQRQGFFADGENVFLAWEGELVANRYRIHRITEVMAEVEEVRSRTRKRLKLELPSE